MLKVLTALTFGAAFVLGFAPVVVPSHAQAAPQSAFQLAQADDGTVEDSEMGTDEAPADDSMTDDAAPDDAAPDDSQTDDGTVEDSEMGTESSGE